MPRHDFERAELELKQLEHDLIRRLKAELPGIVDGHRNTLFFFTTEYNPHDFPEHYLTKTSDELLTISRETIALRKLLAKPTEGCVGRLFEAACAESADQDNPHRLGPKRLAERLLAQIEQLLQGESNI
jgi:hypothetical protein